MKDQTGKEIDREFAPNKRNPEDKYKVTVVKKDPDYDVTQDETKRPIVTKKTT
jgi:predicted hydrolase (HD superfamily)